MENKILDLGFDYEFKENGGNEGYFEGIASPFNGKPDSYGDIVLPGAFSKTIQKGGRNGNGIVMLWMHNPQRPIGTYPLLAEEKRGLKVGGQLVTSTKDGSDMYELMKAKAIQGLSIGYNPIDYEIDEKKKVRYLKEVDLYEISPVTFPAAIRATVTNVKSIIENAVTRKELETALRNEGLSISAAKYIASLIRLEEKKQKGESAEILNQLKQVSSRLDDIQKKRVVTYRPWTKASENTPWDGPVEMRKADVDDLKIISTWYDSDNDDVKSAYKLPHHKSNGYATVWNGVKAAMGALLGARGGVDIPSADRKGVYNHLAKHYRQFEKEPPDFR